MSGHNKAPIGVNVVVFDRSRVLLGERLKEPNRGLLVVPGGKQEPQDSSPEETARREVYEEAGISIAGLKKLMEKLPTSEDFVHRLTYRADAVDPKNIKGGDDLGSPKFYSEQELIELNVRKAISPVVLLALRESGLNLIKDKSQGSDTI